MRLWTVHPRYLDRQGLTGLWREALLAQAVLSGLTRGYRSHPQLIRFRAQAEPLAAIAAYLLAVHAEAALRGYRFNESLIPELPRPAPIVETDGQLALEWAHLKAKLALRSPDRLPFLLGLNQPEPHPLFTIQPGAPRQWEKAKISAGGAGEIHALGKT
jgi:hypothetical protein